MTSSAALAFASDDPRVAPRPETASWGILGAASTQSDWWRILSCVALPWLSVDGPLRGPSDGPLPERPRTRADCIDAPRPCPWLGCRFHTLVASTYVNGKGRLRVCATPGAGGPSRPVGEWTPEELAGGLERMSFTCALDFAEEHPDGASLQEVGDALGLTRERVRQIEESASLKLQRARRLTGNGGASA